MCTLLQNLLLHDHRSRLGVALVRLVAHDAVAQAFVVCLQVRQGDTHANLYPLGSEPACSTYAISASPTPW